MLHMPHIACLACDEYGLRVVDALCDGQLCVCVCDGQLCVCDGQRCVMDSFVCDGQLCV